MFAAPNARRLRQNSWMVKIDVAEIGVKKSGADSICFQKAGSRYKTKGKKQGQWLSQLSLRALKILKSDSRLTGLRLGARNENNYKNSHYG